MKTTVAWAGLGVMACGALASFMNLSPPQPLTNNVRVRAGNASVVRDMPTSRSPRAARRSQRGVPVLVERARAGPLGNSGTDPGQSPAPATEMTSVSFHVA